ncbi:HD domain-containing protein [Ahrensia marina]|uniref:5'-deoxynucleotidase n=1 Tax=Ahrensia marina TaxID=1514904 RepID=A0A0N1J6M1_9HYPH|nr:HD domain-containing protein [Ahrensia marina]KPB02924.1 phosphohydrolase [Ahrensia marina]
MNADVERLRRSLEFLREAERLKDVLRSGVTSQGRRESTAEHTWRLCLMVMVFSDLVPEVDHLKLLKMCLIHDLGEAYAGDVPATEQSPGSDRRDIEYRDVQKLGDIHGGEVGQEIVALWLEYDAGETNEARLAKGFDKLETILQHTQGDNASDFDYAFNLTYGVERTGGHDLLKAIRAIIDTETQERSEGRAAWRDA